MIKQYAGMPDPQQRLIPPDELFRQEIKLPPKDNFAKQVFTWTGDTFGWWPLGVIVIIALLTLSKPTIKKWLNN